MATDKLECMKIFSNNLTNFLNYRQITQKQLSQQIQTVESTISSYINGVKLPTCDFLLKLKSHYPEICIDTFLTQENLTFTHTDDNFLSISSSYNLEKFYGTYYVFFLDTNKKSLINLEASSEGILKSGILYIFKNPETQHQHIASCIAVMGIKNRETVDEIYKKIIQLNNTDEILAYLSNEFQRNLYQGTLKLSQTHIFISLEHERKDCSLIVLRHLETNKPQYFGGLGTVNSASTGYPSDPVIQLIGLSRNKVYLSDEDIQSHLRLNTPSITLGNEANEIISLAETIYKNQDSATPDNLSKYFPTIIRSNLERLIRDNIENNHFRYCKVSSEKDEQWYSQIMNANELHNKEEGNTYDKTNIGQSTRYYSIH